MKDILHWIRLHLSSHIKGHALNRLLHKYGSIEQVIQVYAAKEDVQLAPVSIVEQELEFCNQHNIHTITWLDDRYPALLKQISSAPILLWVKGNAELLRQNNLVSIVGSRNASLSSIQIAKNITQVLGRNNFITVSGLAQGIDTIIHQESLHTGTIAVLGSGINVIYPKSNQKLFHEIAQQGALITELAHNTSPSRQYFPIRNRIIAGIASGLIVIEAKIISGSMLSAKYALDYGRKLMAVPGSPLNERTSGCLQLIKAGAMLVDDLSDIITYLNSDNRPNFADTTTNITSKSQSTKQTEFNPGLPEKDYSDLLRINDSPETNSDLLETDYIKSSPDYSSAFSLDHTQIKPNPKHHNTTRSTKRKQNISKQNTSDQASKNQKMILDLLSFTPVSIDHIVQATKLSTPVVQSIICQLILDKKIVREKSNIYLKP